MHLQEGRPRAAEDVAGGKGELEGAPHEEAAEDAAVHVALLRLAQKRVLQPRVADQHAGRKKGSGTISKKEYYKLNFGTFRKHDTS